MITKTWIALRTDYRLILLTFEVFWIAVFLSGSNRTSDDRGSPSVRVRQFLSGSARMKTTEPKRARDEALDWVKGALVVLMVVYHSLNYSPYTHVAFAYIAFLPPSFIFLAGFLLTSSYLARYDPKDWRLHQRLVMRGAKLILLFTALNAGLYFMAWGPDALSQFTENLQAIYLAAGGRVASFPILTAIGYLLLLAPLLLIIASLNRWVLPGLALALFIYCSVLEWTGSVGYHLGLISIGIIGTALGLVPLERVTAFARRWFVVVPLYCLYRTGSYFIGEPYAMQLTGVATALLVLYCLALKLPPRTQIFRQVVLLGKYSLFGYIIQLGIIQVVVRIFGPFETPLAVSILAVVTLSATWAVTWLIHWLTQMNMWVGRSAGMRMSFHGGLRTGRGTGDHIGTGRCVLGHLDRVVDVDVQGLTFDALHDRRVRG